MNDTQIEQEIQSKGLTGPRITPLDIEENIFKEVYFSADEPFKNDPWLYGPEVLGPLSNITICTLILKNGYKIVGVNTGSVDPNNFDFELAKKLARQQAVNQLWPLLGFELKQKLFKDSTRSRYE